MLLSSFEDAFGDAADPRKMRSETMSKGEFGLSYFYHQVVTEVLDELERDGYEEIYSMVMKCCSALARKVSNRIKVSLSLFVSHSTNILQTPAGTGARQPSPRPDTQEGSSVSSLPLIFTKDAVLTLPIVQKHRPSTRSTKANAPPQRNSK